MEYAGKRIHEEAPAVADSYRKAYAEGIQKFIERKNEEAKLLRRQYMEPEELVKDPEKYRTAYQELLGLPAFAKEAACPAQMSYVGSDEVCRIYRLQVFLTEEIPFYAMLLLPHQAAKPMPLVIAQHGGGGTPELCSDFYGKNNYNHMVQRVLERGYAALVPQLLLWSTKEIETQRAHDIPYQRQKIDVDMKRFGGSITALEIHGIRRSLDYVCGLEEIDGENVKMIGLSYGGYFTLHTMAADTRIKAGYCAGVFNDRDIYDWADWSYQGSALRFQDAEVAALCAPRKLYIQVGVEDPVFDYRSAVTEAERISDYFAAFGVAENFRFNVWEGGHTISDHEEGMDFIFG